MDEAAKVGEQVEHVDALNEHVIGYHNTEEESVTKIKHVPPNMKKHSEDFAIISEKTKDIFLKLLLSILTTHLDWKLHLNDSIGNPGNLQISAHTDCNKTTLTMLAEDNASRNSVDHNRSAGI